jgi:hypothetical protein
MTCKGINNLLSAYLDGLLPREEKMRVEEHLKSCSLCSQDFAGLKKTVDLLQNLPEVEPPPFFEQRIMAAIREEGKQKDGILRKFFFPLHIKIPLQALTTILITVFAFYVYQKSDPEVKQLTPPIPLTESVRNQAMPDVPKAPAVSPAATQNKQMPSVPPVSLPSESRQSFAPPPPAVEAKQDGIVAPRAPVSEERLAMMAPKDTASAGRARDGALKKEVDKLPAVPLSNQSRKAKMDSAGNMAGASREMAPAAAPSRSAVAPLRPSALELTIHVREVPAGLRDVESCLGGFNARIIEREHRGGAAFLKAEMDARHVAAFVNRLGDLGRVEMEKGPAEFPEGRIGVGIKIDRFP